MYNLQMSSSTIIQLLESSGVHCSDPVKTVAKISKIRQDGPRKLKVMSDFDHTLSLPRVNSKAGCTTHGVIETSSILPMEYRQKAADLKKLYLPFEISHNIPKVERIKAMEQWWEKAHSLLIEYKVTKSMLSEMVKNANIGLRDGHKEFFSLLNESDVPLILFSAGVGDIIAEILIQKSSYLRNVEIVGNKMIFDGEGVLQGFSEPIIHSFNKGATAVAKINHLRHKLLGRHNVLLLGDSQGDPFMVDESSDDGISDVLRIGYLNHDSAELLPVYTKLYDIVISGENDSLLLPNTLVKYLVNHNNLE